MPIWSITNIAVIPQADQYSSYAWQVNWTCSVTDGVQTKSMTANVTFQPSEQSQAYIPYNELTEAQVVSWVKESIGAEKVAKTEAVLTNLLVATQASLPWASVLPVETVNV